MKKPNGAELLSLLIDLLAEQEGIVIEYEIESVSEPYIIKGNTARRNYITKA